MRDAGQAYVRAFNQRHGRTGTLWQGRFKSSLVDSEAYALRVIRYIELNPVRQDMVERALNRPADVTSRGRPRRKVGAETETDQLAPSPLLPQQFLHGFRNTLALP